MNIAVDFDGTCVDHCFPDIGEDVPGAVETLKDLVKEDNWIYLWTVRSGQTLEDAVNWFCEKGIFLHGINENPQQIDWNQSRKMYCPLYIDDAAFGCPLKENPRTGGKPYVNWDVIREALLDKTQASDYESCPKCKSLFTFMRPENGKCPWCKFDLEAE